MLDFLDAGLGPVPIGSPGGGSLVVFPFSVYETKTLDLTQLASNIEIVPAKPGHWPFATAGFFVIESTAGTQTSAASIRAGNDSGHVNLIAASAIPTNGDVNGANPPSFSSAFTAPANATQRFANLPCFLDITTAAQGTGGFTLLGRFQVTVFWLPIE